MQNYFNIRKRKIYVFTLILISAAINAIGTKLFLVPEKLLPSGTAGVATGLEHIIKFYTNLNIHYYYLFFLINLPIIIWAFTKLKKAIIYKTILNVCCFTIISLFLPSNLKISQQPYVNAISGGFLLGLSNVILLYVGASGTGLDLIGLHINAKYNKNIMGKINATFNAIMYITYIPFSSYDKAFMSFISTIINSLITDRFHINSRYVLLLIVTKKHVLVNEYIVEKAKRGDILIDSMGGYSQVESKTIITAISKHKFKQTISHLKKIDENIYTIVLPTEKIIGRMKSKVGESNI